MSPEHIKILSELSIPTITDWSRPSGFMWINDSIKSKIAEDIVITEYTNLYPHIIIDLFDNGFLPETESENISRIKFILENKEFLTLKIQEDEQIRQNWREAKQFINSYYGKLGNPFDMVNSKISSHDPNSGIMAIRRLQKYLEIVYSNILSNNTSILYIDTDIIFSKGDINMDFSFDGIPYTKRNIDILVIENMKKYFYYDNGILEKRGSIDVDKYSTEIISIMRNRRLDNIGI